MKCILSVKCALFKEDPVGRVFVVRVKWSDCYCGGEGGGVRVNLITDYLYVNVKVCDAV